MRKLLLVFCMLLLFFGCSENPPTEAISGTVTVIMEIDNNSFMSETVSFTQEISAYDATLIAAEQAKIDISFSGSGKSAFLEAANGYKNGDDGPMSGWLFNINEQPATVGCGDYTIKDGDTVKWYYTKDFSTAF